MSVRGIARGFGLIELMVTITIIAVLLILVTPTFSNSISNARERSAVQKFTQDFDSLRGTAGSAGTAIVTLRLETNCTWTATVNGAPDDARSMLTASGLACTGDTLPLPVTFAFTPQGFTTPNGTLTFTGTKGQAWPLQVLYSGSIVRLKGAS